MGVHLTLGPLLYNWPASTRRDFYFCIADEAPLDTVYVGEVVCAKRAPLFDSYWPEVIERLQVAGKTVIHASPILAMGRDGWMAAGDFPLPVEANDVGAIGVLRGRPHYVGPFVNVHNPDTLAVLVRQGAVRVCLPVETCRARCWPCWPVRAWSRFRCSGGCRCRFPLAATMPVCTGCTRTVVGMCASRTRMGWMSQPSTRNR